MTEGVPRPLTGWRVLVPRGGEWGERVAELLTGRGASATVVPVIEFRAPADVAALDAAVTRLVEGLHDWLVVTSATTVTALAARAAAMTGLAPPEALSAATAGTPVAAVGPGTARALERYGVTPALTPVGESSAQGLAAEFPAPSAHTDPAGGRSARSVLLPQSDLAGSALADALRAGGWAVDVVIAYRTVTGPVPSVEVREDMRSGCFDAVLLSSGSTVAGLLELVGPPPPTTLVCCLGPRTARSATEHGLAVHVVPHERSAEALVDALAQHALANRRTEEAP